ncbi:hypothetical protein pipiens_003107 [Culex pipiens pipiens]|uniref:Uncharacterized protein n=1 Tax=Culex pipiens pipiens TaxID=38569 RepID=A0ABD1D4X2_CULPP
MKKMLSEASTELGRAVRRADTVRNRWSSGFAFRASRKLVGWPDRRGRAGLGLRPRAPAAARQRGAVRPSQRSTPGCRSASPDEVSTPMFLSGSYYDAKPSFIDNEDPYDTKDKSLNNMFDFERAKQKFDNISRSTGASTLLPRRRQTRAFRSVQSSLTAGVSGVGTNNSGYYDCNGISGDRPRDDSIPMLSSKALGMGGGGGGANGGINDAIQFFDHDNQRGGGVGKLNITKVNNINLDGLKVSEDDETP